MFSSTPSRTSRRLDLVGSLWAFTDGPAGEWYPLTPLSHMLDCQIYGPKPAGHHVTNVLLHAATTVLLFLVLWRMTGQRAVPGTDRRLVAAQVSGGEGRGSGPDRNNALALRHGGGNFGFIPCTSNRSPWIAQRRDVLSGLFSSSPWGPMTNAPRLRGRYCRMSLAALFALGLLSKPILVTMPALLLLLDYWPLGRIRALPLRSAPAICRPAYRPGD